MSKQNSGQPISNRNSDRSRRVRVLMLLENESYPEDCRVLQESESLVDAGYDVTVVCPTGDSTRKAERIGRVQVYRYPEPWQIPGFLGYVLEYGYSLPLLFLFACFVLVRRGFDVVHVHTPPDMTALVAYPFKLLGKRLVFDHHDLSPELYQAQQDGGGSRLVERVLLWFEQFACRKADRLIATNETQRRVQTERCGADPDHCYIVRNGPSEMFLGEVDPLPELRREGKALIGYVGVIGIQDGVDYMIRALHNLKSRCNRHDFHAIIIGGGPALSQIKQLASRLELADYVTFTGKIPFADVPAHIASFDIAITPDPSNAYNDSCTTIKTMEYMALSKPTVCFETHENQQTAGPAAVYASNNDVADFARAIQQLMDQPQRRGELGGLARRRIEEDLTWDRQAERLVELYDELFGRLLEVST